MFPLFTKFEMLFVVVLCVVLCTGTQAAVCKVTFDTYAGADVPGYIKLNDEVMFPLIGNTSAYVAVIVDPLCNISDIMSLPQNADEGVELDLVHYHDLVEFLKVVINAVDAIKGYGLVATINGRGPLELLDTLNVTDPDVNITEPLTNHQFFHFMLMQLGAEYNRTNLPAANVIGTTSDPTTDTWAFFLDVNDFTATTSYVVAEGEASQSLDFQFDIIDTCATNPGCSYQCVNSKRSYYCECETGLVLDTDNKTCIEIDECEDELDNCDQICTNTVGNYTCDCHAGYTLEQGHLCQDIDECEETASHNCSDICNNTAGGFFCTCLNGYQLQDDNSTCEDINECDTSPCSGSCNNTAGGYFCSCNDGYQLMDDDQTCEDINECSELNGGCVGACVNYDGGFSCNCTQGYELGADGFSCENINECERDEPCEQVCVDREGSYQCSCRSGYTISGESCIDIDECQLDTDGCQGGCNNTDGGFLCTCEEGLQLQADSVTCQDINECATDNGNCSTHCNNIHKSYFCSCDSGFVLQIDGHTCADINECSDNNGNCSHSCDNNDGSYSCSCPQGFVLQDDQRTCQELYCNTTQSCQNGGVCVEEVGTARCDCLSGYTGSSCETKLMCYFESCENGGTCNEVDPGDSFSCACLDIFTGTLCETQLYCVTNNTCENGATCHADSEGVTCECLPGFTGVDCETELYCETSNTCTNGATCSEGETSALCECLPGFSGENCETALYCNPVDPCNNGGTCSEGTGVAVCDCLPDYTGTTCETKLWCLSDPCENNGTCTEVDPGEGYECECPVGFTDQHCSTKLYCVLENNCVNGGVCVEGEDSALCNCQQGFAGNLCENEDLCVTSNTCVQGNCSMTEAADDIVCDCIPGYTGEDCEIQLYCAPVDPCENAGVCSEGVGEAICDCPAGTTGTRCQTVLFCEPDNPCQNGGTCSELPDEGGAECDCVPGWQSRYCNLDADECNFGTDSCTYDCINTPGSYTCACFDGYQLAADSLVCEDINECDVSNGECSDTCNNNDGSYTCSCPTGYRLKPDQKECTDIDECIYPDTCGHNCTNTEGSYECTCLDGYQLQADKKTCSDTDECADNNGGCTGICINKEASYRCTCDSGSALQQDGKTCVAIPTALTFTSYSPSYGPVDGGTRVTVEGSIPAQYSVTGVSLKVSADVGQDTLPADAEDILQCTLNSTTESGVVFETPAVSVSSVGVNYSIDIGYKDSSENVFSVDTAYTFLYKPNPVISTVFPLQFKTSGGTPVTVKGNNFFSVSEPKLCVYVVRRELLPNNAGYRVLEKHKICTTNVRKQSTTQMVAIFPEIPSSILSIRDLTRRKRETGSTMLNNELLQIYIGFDLDGVEEYTDLRQALGQDQGSIEVFNTPVVEQFTDVLVFNPKTEDNIEIKGSGFLDGVRADDYRVTLGADVCQVTSVTDTLVTCSPPEEEPEAVQGPYYRRQVPHLMLTVGNFEAPVGYVDYSGRDKTLMYVLIGIVTAIVLVALVVILVQIILPRRNRYKNRYREYRDDPRQPRITSHEGSRERDGQRHEVADFYSPGWQPPTRKYYSRP